MPVVTMFWGIIITMYNNNEHNPPHFHAKYQDHEAVFSLDGELLQGDMPNSQRKHIAAWADRYHAELVANWELAMNKQPIYKIEPLR